MKTKPGNKKLHGAIYEAFDKFCSGAKGYNSANNREIFDNLNLVLIDYNLLINTAMIYAKDTESP